jgi:protein SCO1
MRFLAGALALCLLAGSTRADTAQSLPPELQGVTFKPLIKEQIPLDLPFRDEDGKTVRLRDYFSAGQPVILVLVQYRCEMLCNLVLNGLTSGMRELAGKRGFRVGEHFSVVTVSFDDREKPALAKAKKAAYVEEYGLAGAAQGWHFLTGDRAAIDQLAEKAGFQFRPDPKRETQFVHATGILVLTPEGRISRFFPGMQFDDYQARDLYYGLVEASQYRLGQPITDRVVLLFCYSYDPVRGTYAFTIMNIVRISGLLTMLALGTFLVLMLRWERRKAGGQKKNGTADERG